MNLMLIGFTGDEAQEGGVDTGIDDVFDNGSSGDNEREDTEVG